VTRPQAYVTNLELRESNADGSEGAGLSHSSAGLLLLHVLELASHGEPRGCATVLHDAGDHGARYQELAHALASGGWAVALPDLRGHGRSEGARGHSWGFREVARDVDAILDHLAYRLPDEPQVLIGQGVGATQALAYALERPERVAALVALSPLLAPRFHPPRKQGALRGLFRKIGPTTPGHLGWTPEERTGAAAAQAAIRADPQMHDTLTLRGAEAFAEALERVHRGAARLATPTLILHGADDRIADPALARGLARDGVEVRVLGGRRHDLLHEGSAAEDVRAVAAWLDGAVPRR
jgi:alpha-beta hydrolase superfamily lysophospholipase